MSSLSVLLESLVDDARVFPPTSLSIDRALDEHLVHQGGAHAELLGRFLTPASRLPELLEAVARRLGPAEDIVIGLIADTGPDGIDPALALLAEEPRLILGMVQIALPHDTTDPAGTARGLIRALPAVEGYVEVPRVPGWTQALEVIGDSAYGAKLRTGGPRAEDFPSVAEVAEFIIDCVHLEVPFTATAGLHHAVRHTDPTTGFTHHGFLNLLAATSAVAVGGADRDEVRRLLEVDDGTRLVTRLTRLDDTEATLTRSFFVAYGSCRIAEPVADPVALGVLDPVEVAPGQR